MSGRNTPGGRNTPLSATATQRGQSSNLGHQSYSRSQSLLDAAKLEEQIHLERMSRADSERRLLEFEERCAADKIATDEQHRHRLLEMFLVAGHLHEDRKTEAAREKLSVDNSCTPAVVEQLQKVAHHCEVERSVVDALRRQLEARLSSQRAEAAKEREKVQFYRTMLIRRMRQCEEHVRMVCGTDHWLLRLPDLADREKPFTSVSGFAVQSSPAAKQFDVVHSPVPAAAGVENHHHHHHHAGGGVVAEDHHEPQPVAPL